MAIQSVTKRLETPTYFIWPKLFIRHCVIQAALAHQIPRLYLTLEITTLIGRGETKILKIAYPFVKMLFKFKQPGVVLQAFQPPFQLHCSIKVNFTLPWQNVACPLEVNMLARCVALLTQGSWTALMSCQEGDYSLYS